jgi:radical SAM-linked protein
VRFLSHHETVHALELAAARAAVPLRYTQGFNPHPILSLAAPRPVGVSSRDELLVMSLDSLVQPADLLAALAAQVPEGVRFLRAEPLESRGYPRPLCIGYELALGEAELGGVRDRLAVLAAEPTWPVERWTPPKGRRRGEAATTRIFDVKPMIADLRLEGSLLRWSAVPAGDAWPRCGDVLKLVGLDERVKLADVVRTAVNYATDDRAEPSQHNEGSPPQPPQGRDDRAETE